MKKTGCAIAPRAGTLSRAGSTAMAHSMALTMVRATTVRLGGGISGLF